MAPGDTEQAELVASFHGNVLSLLRAHHEGEDELLTPRLAERLPAQAGLISAVAKLWLILGLTRQQLSDTHRGDMDAHLPPPIAAMWAGAGEALFQQFVTQLHG